MAQTISKDKEVQVSAKQVSALRGLDLPQAQQRLSSHVRSLSMDRDPMYFDDQVVNLMKEYAYDEEFISQTVAELDSIGYTSSRYTYSQIEEQIQKFQTQNVPYFGWNKNFKKAKELLSQELGEARLRSIHYHENDEVMDYLPKKDTHAGFSFLETGLRTKGEYGVDILPNLVKQEEEAKRDGTFGKPLMLGTRTQASVPYDDDGVFTASFKTKSRLVSMVDIYTILSEIRFARPVQKVLNQVTWYAGGKDDNRINNLLNYYRSRYDNWMSIDYSGFDQSISTWLIREAFDVVRVMFDDPSFDEELYRVIVHDFCNKYFLDANGNLRLSEKGIPSGSMFTQIIGSIINRLMVQTYLHARNISSFEMIIMGDDNIIFTHNPLVSEDLAGYLNSNFGVQVGAEKSSKGTRHQHPEFLSRTWSYAGAYRHPKHLIAKIAYPERFRNYAGGKVFAELVLYSYIIGYPMSMEKLIDVTKFHRDYPNLENKMREVGTQGLSGFLRFNLEYLQGL